MKKIFAFVLPIIIVTGLVYFFKNSPFEKKILGTFSQNEEVQSFKNDIEISYKEETLKIHWFNVDTTKIALIPNFEKPLTAREVQKEYGCTKLANGGFYTKENTPLGLFMNDNGILSSFLKSSLLSGVLSINYLETPRITREQPKDILRIGIQSGPLIKENATYLKIVSNEEEARRTIAFVTGENKLYFAIIYDPDSSFMGPVLSDLPVILQTFEEKSGLIIADAINLDGGSTSSFIDGDFTLNEISFSGSFFCEQD